MAAAVAFAAAGGRQRASACGLSRSVSVGHRRREEGRQGGDLFGDGYRTVRPLIKDFESLYGVKVEYNDMNSTELYNRFISESAGEQHSADVLWSSAMDLQVKLVNDGYG